MRLLTPALLCALLCVSSAAAEPLRWSPTAGSTGVLDGSPTVELGAACRQTDPRLAHVAGRILARQVAGEPPPSPQEVEILVRAAGVPQPFPRAWVAFGPQASSLLARDVGRWVGGRRGIVRCGVARGEAPDLGETMAVVAVDVAADLTPTPTRVEPTAWVSLRAQAWVPVDEATVVLLGPQGRTRKVLTSVDVAEGHIRSTFRLGAPGRWRVQVLASTNTGPEPVLELELFSGVAPPRSVAGALAPRTPEPRAHGDRGALELLNRARRTEGLAPLARDPDLDAVARAHAARMIATGQVAHDVGDGDPTTRASASGVVAWTLGENVAQARSIAAAHDAMWLSPSHRDNMLHATYSRVGVAALRDAEGRWWVVQLFAA